MGSKNDMTRKDFLTLTFTLIGSTAVGAAACSSDNNNAVDGGGHGGTTGSGGTTSAGGHGGTTGAGGTTGTGGTGGTGGGAGGNGGGAGTSSGGTSGTTGAGGTGGTGTAACTDPLPETMVADTTGHSHSVMIAASKLDATTAQTIDTSIAEPGTASAHMHAVTLETTQLATLKGGGTVTVMSTLVMSHGHMFMISCH